MMTREGARGQEYNAWGGEGGNPPEHETILFFTRMLAGPMDFTPGIFDILIERGTGRPRRPEEARVRPTLAKQLALYVVLYSPLQMAADLPENYEHQPAFQFIRDVPVDWDTTRVLEGKIGDYVVVARRERSGESWYVGAITDEEGRSFDVPLRPIARPWGPVPGRPALGDLPGLEDVRRRAPAARARRDRDPVRLLARLAGVQPAGLRGPVLRAAPFRPRRGSLPHGHVSDHGAAHPRAVARTYARAASGHRKRGLADPAPRAVCRPGRSLPRDLLLGLVLHDPLADPAP